MLLRKANKVKINTIPYNYGIYKEGLMDGVNRAHIKDGLVARQAAFAVLNNILVKNKRMSDAFFMEQERLDNLSSRDRVLVKQLTSVVLKHKIELDLVLKRFIYEEFKDLRPNTLINIFRLGLAQFLYMDIAPYSVVNNTLDLVESEGLTSQKQQVSSVIRRITHEGLPAEDSRDSAKVNTPEWLWNEWVKDYGEDTAYEIALSNMTDAMIDISVKKDVERWAKTLSGTILPTGSIRKNEAAALMAFEGSFDRECWVQNAASAVAVKLFGDLRDKNVIDLCAAPGIKTAQLASGYANVIAAERSASSLKILEKNMSVLGLEIATVVADGTVWKPDLEADCVLVDAPSTETGMLRGEPDILHFIDKVDQDKHVNLQRNLLSNAANMVKEGGTLIYTVPSLQKAEGEHQFDWVLDKNLPLRPYPIRTDELEGVSEMITIRGEFRSLPCYWEDIGGIDGCYIARFVKI